ncbi:cytochrome c oxidase subunit 3 [Nocardia bovistercoris]|uniref:Cytochrome aa3 subunit 3 n=1 Tax=Nocardia bovistercoris TaxID=2785916 RepID=A0A931IA73_9NOCA|nr:cytochrome c oxidase subunit 3 [Nocardia bovistercoris]MBH0776715.1 cytochrome c oxidase subunit 3 [Nocardia bovistercoris]
MTLIRERVARAEPAKRLPGEEGIWVFVLGDMCVFALFFGIFVFERTRAPEAYEAGRQLLDTTSGAINTLLLLTSSLLVVRAVAAGDARRAPRLFLAALLCGVGFVIVKAVEWARLLSAGMTPSGGGFFGYYFMFTGTHLAHVVIGVLVLARLVRLSRKPRPTERTRVLIESGAIFWHMVDLLWVVLFPLFYLMQ